jgi:N-acetylglucosamine-6-phosphate deacetylase
VIHLAGLLFDPEHRGFAVVAVEDGVVRSIDRIEGGELREAELPPGTLGGPGFRILPGLVDIQVNGAFGHDFADPAADMGLVCRRLPELGVTAFSPTIVTSAPETYPAALANLNRPARPGEARVLGAHIEGPFLSPRRAGTHDPGRLRLPSRAEAAGWLEAGDVRWVTLAPELQGALELTRFLVDRGVRVSIGHTDATWAEAEAGAGAGASLVTHLFNAMRPFRHRDPGVAGFALESDLPVGLIADGEHVAFETIRLVARVKAPDQLYLVTDALAGLGMPPGPFALAGRECLSDGVVGRLSDGTLSGSLLPLPRALANLVDVVGLEPALAVRMATLNPARALGLEAGIGRVAVQGPADLVLVDAAWQVATTVAGGQLAYEAAPVGTGAASVRTGA